MKFRAIENIIHHIKIIWNRLPLSILFAVMTTILMCIVAGLDRREFVNPIFYQYLLEFLNRAAFVTALGISLFLALTTFCEQRSFTRWQRLAVFLSGLIFLMGYYAYLTQENFNSEQIYLSALIFINCHLLVVIAPFSFKSNQVTAFWQFSRYLFVRIIISGFFSLVLYGGLAGALGAIDHLFSIQVDHKLYTYLWFTIVGIFNTLYFLAGVPVNINQLENDNDYPQVLKIFTQFILVPLVSLYLVILYLYLGKIILAWSLPIGWVSWLVIIASIMGILTLLLVWPLRDKSEFGWLKIYARYFFLILFPLIGLMIVAITTRIGQYGITVERYFIVLYSAWLLLIAVLFTINANRHIRIIPTTLFLVILFATWGPWSALSVSRRSQIERLTYYLQKNNLIINGQIQKKNDLPLKDRQEISSIVDYLVRTHGTDVFKNVFQTENYDHSKNNYFQQSDYFLKEVFGFSYVHENTTGEQITFDFARNKHIEVKNYDYLTEFNSYDPLQRMTGPIKCSFDKALLNFTIEANGETITIHLNEELEKLYKKYGNSYNFSAPEMNESNLTIEETQGHLSIKMLITHLGAKRIKENKFTNANISVKILLKYSHD